MKDNIERILYTEEQIHEAVNELGIRISKDYAGKKLLILSILKGSVMFMSDLMRAITLDYKIDFMSLSSYGSGVKTSGAVKLLKDINTPIEGMDVLIVEDIMDSGTTLSYVMEMLKAHSPASLKIAVLLDKSGRRCANITADYSAFESPDEFLVGYGLDYNEHYRGLPYIGVLKHEAYA